MLVPARTPQAIPDLIKASCRAWRSTLGTICHLIGPMAVVKTLLPILLVQMVISSQHTVEQSSVLGVAIIALIATFIMGCCFYAVALPQSQQPMPTKKVISATRKCAPLFLTVWLLCAALSMLASMLFVIPGILLYIYTKYAKLIALFEDTTISQAITRSLRLVSGNWWRVFAIEAFIIVVNFIAALFAKPIAMMLTAPLTTLISTQTNYQTIIQNVSLFITVLIVQIIVLPILINLHLLQLNDLNIRHRSQNSHNKSRDTITC